MAPIDLFGSRTSDVFRKLGERLPTSADILESEDAFIVLVDVPGCEKSDIQARLDDNTLIVTADREEVRSDFVTVAEGRPKHLRTTVPLPEDVDGSTAQARYDDGVLRVRLEKTAPTDIAGKVERPDVAVEVRHEREETTEIETATEETEEETAEDAAHAAADPEGPASRGDLEGMEYRELQNLAKANDVTANLAKDEMIDELADALDLE